MKAFLQRFGAFVLGVLVGFDRWRFRGSKRRLCYEEGMRSFLSYQKVLLKDFNKPYARDLTVTLGNAIEKPAKEAGIYRYLNSSKVGKEETALALAAQLKKTEGLIAVLSCVEPCQTLRVRKNWQSKQLELRREPGKCMHYYHYYLDATYGLRYTRLQSWFPFTMHAGLNGREWLAQQLTKAGVDFIKKDNCFPWIKDFAKAQQLMDQQLETAWQPLLDSWARESFPLGETLLKTEIPYYWSVQEGEFATDIAFRSAEDLARWFRAFVHHAYATLHGRDLLRFLNYRQRTDGGPVAQGQVTTTLRELVEGTCVHHRIMRNLLKMYDKMMSVLRIESLLLDLQHFKVFRTKEGDEQGPMSYLPLRKGVADLHRRAQVSAKINDRYIDSLASVAEPQTLAELTEDLTKRTIWKGQPVRGLNPLAAEDAALLAAVSRGEFLISGFSNRDIRNLLFAPDPSADQAEQKRRSAKVTRLFRILRGHHLIIKEHHANRYKLTERGRTQLSSLLAARQATTQQLLQAA
jgi:hypothetical protein